jgi:hypothetical protein
MRQIAPASFALLLVGVAFFGSYAGMQSRDAREGDAKIQHDATQNRYSPEPRRSARAESHEGEATLEQGKEHRNRDFFGPEWFLVWVSIPLAAFTALLFAFTRKLATDAEKTGAKALAASTEHTEMLVKIERAHLTGGGPSGTMDGQHVFRLEVANYGKTPAFLCAFDVHFTTLDVVQAGPQEVFPWYPYEDWIPPGPVPRPIRFFRIDPSTDKVVYGAFWYQDWQKRAHIFRFILRIESDTQLGIMGVDDSYTYWD